MFLLLFQMKKYRSEALSANKSLQRTFDPPPIFAFAKTGVASNAAEFRRYVYFIQRPWERF